MVEGLILSIETRRNEGIEKRVEYSKMYANDFDINANFPDKQK